MSNYAYIEDGIIIGLYDTLPTNWKNISNFYVLSAEELHPLNWRVIQKDIPEYDPSVYKIGNPRHEVIDDIVYERYDLIPLPTLTEEELAEQNRIRIANQWDEVRRTRDLLMQEFEWKYNRYDREVRLNINPTDDLEKMDLYMQSLADITKQEDPFNIIWPEYITENNV